MKIALVAMSGIRVCDPQLLEVGLTLPGFVERGKTVASLPSLGLLTLAGMTPAHHRCDYIEIKDIRDLGRLPRGYDLVAISSYSAQIHEAYELADRYRALGTPVVMGGLHVSVLPDEAARHCDAVVIGDGESSWREVLRDAEAGRLEKLYRPEEEFSLSEAPLPAFELLDIDKYNRLTVQTSRGCPFRCEFCAGSILLSPRYRQKPAEKVLAEIDGIQQLWRRPFIELADDNSMVDRKYWKHLLPQLERRKIRWFAETDLSIHEDEELLMMMRDSGCAQVLIGLESPLPVGLDGLEMNSNWKLHRWPEYKEAIRRIQSHGIRVNGCFILGLDGQGPEIFDETYDFAVESELYDVQITLQTPFPGTPLYERLRSEDRLLCEEAWERCTLFDVNYRPTHMTVSELRDGFRKLGERLYSDELTRWRRGNFKRKYLAGAGRSQEQLS